MIGEILGDHFEIQEKIGRGGFATVYRALDTKLKRHVAIKVLNDPGGNRDFRNRFRRESEWLAGFRHPNIVTVYDVNEHDGTPYLVMELIEGASLDQLVARTPMPCDEVCKMGVQVCRAMAYSHGKGIIHRDLTLKNIMVEIDETEEPLVKILDFGLAKYLHQDVTQVVATMGTAPYLAPEQIRGDGIDGRADIFAFGVCLYRMSSDRFPFQGEHPTATMYRICNESHIEYPDDMDPDLRELIAHCLQKKPQDRPRGFAPIIEMLQGCGRQETASEVSFPAPLRSEALVERRVRRGNPYLNRTMIRKPEDFFGREREIRRICSSLDAPKPQSVSVVGERRIGKSSLLNHIYDSGVRSRTLQRCEETIFVYLDFQGCLDFDVARFIEFVFGVFRLEDRAIAEAAGDEYTRGALQAMIQRMHDDGKRLVVLMDEFECITRNPEFDERFFGFLRSLAQHYRVAYVTSSCDELQKMCHEKTIADSPFFNIFTNLPLRPFLPDEARRLIADPSREAGAPLEPHAERILALGGHFPLFLQIACASVFEVIQETADGEPDWPAATARFMDEAGPHFASLWDRLGEAEREILARVAAGEAVDKAGRLLADDLVRDGTLLKSGDRYRLFADSFAAFLAARQGVRANGNPLRRLFRRFF